jgi:hypothetical protein
MRGRRVQIPAPFFSRSGRDARRSHVGTIDEPEIPIDLALLVEPDLQGFENAIEGSVGSPAVETMIDTFPFSVAFGQIAPGGSGTKNPEHAIEVGPMIVPFAAASLFGKQAFEKLPLFVADFVSRHGPP